MKKKRALTEPGAVEESATREEMSLRDARASSGSVSARTYPALAGMYCTNLSHSFDGTRRDEHGRCLKCEESKARTLALSWRGTLGLPATKEALHRWSRVRNPGDTPIWDAAQKELAEIAATEDVLFAILIGDLSVEEGRAAMGVHHKDTDEEETA